MMIRCIDFETTGIPTETDPHAVVEIGWCDMTDRPLFVDWPQAVLCNPGRPIPHEAMAIHHITDADVADATGSLDGLGVPDYFAAHNADYERQFLKTEVPFICTYKVALRLWPDAAAHSLQFLRYHLALPANPVAAMHPHRAGPDAYLCALLLEKIMQQENAPDFETMVRWSNGPALLPRINFGKHKGKKWEEAPVDYLEWIVNKSDLDRDIKANAKLHLRKGVPA